MKLTQVDVIKRLTIIYDGVQIPKELCFKSHIAAHTLYYFPEKEASSEKNQTKRDKKPLILGSFSGR